MKLNIVVRLQNWMDSVPGQTFLNYAYSWGASVVILGALFKLTHLPGGNIMLFLGMGTEVVVFFLAAFDRPFDKNEIGKEIPDEIPDDEAIVRQLEGEESPEDPIYIGDTETSQPSGGVVFVGGGTVPAGGTVFVGGGSAEEAPSVEPLVPASTESPDAVAAARAALAELTPEGEQPYENEASRLAAIIRAANDELLRRAQAALSPEMEEATEQYIEKLRTLSETFARVDEQSARLAADSREMEELSRTLTGINKVYEMHLKSISLQVGTIDTINEQTSRLAQQIEQLNAVYARMIEAMTVNMRN